MTKLKPKLPPVKNPFAGPKTILSCVANNDIKGLTQLIESGTANLSERDKDGKTALILASMKGYTNIVDILIKKGADVDAKDNKGRSVLMLASMEGQQDIVDILIKKGADVDAKDNKGRNALMLASMEGYANIVDILIKKGADVDEQDQRGATALMLAAQCMKEDTLTLLIENEANINAKDLYGNTALIHIARKSRLGALQKHSNILHLLVEKGADVNMSNNQGDTAVIVAIENGNTSCAQHLLKNKANPLTKNEEGKSVLSLAISGERTDLTESITCALNGAIANAVPDAERVAVAEVVPDNTLYPTLDDMARTPPPTDGSTTSRVESTTTHSTRVERQSSGSISNHL